MLNQLRNRRGVALPLALMGLVVVSFLVMTAIVTSGTELTISSSHQQATAGFYEADGTLERYVANKAATAGTDSLYPVSGDQAGSGYLMDVGRLSSAMQLINDGKTMFQRQVYSLVTYPADNRGRSIGAFVRTERTADLFMLSVDAGLTVGGNVSITGSSTISDGRDAVACDSTLAAENALQVTSGSTVTKSGSSIITGTVDTTTWGKEEMIERLLGGMTIQEAILFANVKFAAGEYTGTKPRSHDTGTPRLRTNKYNWGCPANGGLTCSTYSENASNVLYYPMVAIDAGGGTVTINGDHGQGVLIVHNGSLVIEGNMVYHGIIVVDKDLMIKGTGGSGGGVKIQGAVVALGTDSTVEDTTSGNATIVYNSCIAREAQHGANEHRLASAPQTFPSQTANWFEIYR